MGFRLATDKLFLVPAPKWRLFCRSFAPSGNFGHKVFGLEWTEREVPGDPDIDASSCGHPERAYRPKSNSIRRPYASEKHLGKRRDDMAPQADSRPKQIRNLVCSIATCAHQRITAEFAHNPDPAVRVVHSLAADAVGVERLRSWNAIDPWIGVIPDIVIATEQLDFGRFYLLSFRAGPKGE